jgi:hypothetical protein
MSSYRVRLQVFDEADDAQRQQAEQRFCKALEAALGAASLVVPVYRQVLRLYAAYGESPDPASLSESERDLLQAWQQAEAAALGAALGPHRYMDDAQFEILMTD